MEPKRARAPQKDKEVAPEEAPGPLPALEKTRIVNEEGLAKVRLLAGTTTNEWGDTRLWPGSSRRNDLDATAYPIFYHAIATGLVAPFSPFLLAMLEHYQIQLLHLHPNSITILAIFAYTC